MDTLVMSSLGPRRERAYALRTWDKPPTIETYLVHPFMQQSEDGSVTELGIAEVEEPATTRRPGQSNPNRCPLSTNHRPLEMPAASSSGPAAGALTLILIWLPQAVVRPGSGGRRRQLETPRASSEAVRCCQTHRLPRTAPAVSQTACATAGAL